MLGRKDCIAVFIVSITAIGGGKGHGADMKKGCAGIMIKKRQHKDKKIEKKKIMKIILNKKMTTRAAQE